jgi:hypothetical protein
MLLHFQLLLVLSHRLSQSAWRVFSAPIEILNRATEQARWEFLGDPGLVLERIHWSPVTGTLLAALSFVGFLLLVRYLQSANRPSPHLSPADIFVSVATGLIGLAVCWATN